MSNTTGERFISDELKQCLVERYNDIEFVDENTKTFYCSRCQHVVIHHYIANCGHLFCKNCNHIISTEGIKWKWKCLLCKIQITDIDKQDQQIEDQVLSLKVKCPNKKYGCQKIDKLITIAIHLSECKDTAEANLPAVYGATDSHNSNQLLLRMGEIISKEMTQLDLAFNFRCDNILRETTTKLDNLQENISALQNKSTETVEQKCLTILLLGETQTGKSTLINAFANYLQYESFTSAMEHSEEICLIPAVISVSNDNYEPVTMSVGNKDPNEIMEAGRSLSASCKSYLFNINNFQLRFIDSPGFATKKGRYQEYENQKNIYSYISQYDVIHKIAIVFKADNPYQISEFSYTLQQILANLHKDAAKNIVFIFTHKMTANDTIPTVRALMAKIKTKWPSFTEITINRSNAFIFENNLFKYLMACKRGHTVDISKEELEFLWKKNSDEFKRLVDSTKTLENHHIQPTLNIIQLRTFYNNLLIIGDIIENDLKKQKSDISASNLLTNEFDETDKNIEKKKELVDFAVGQIKRFLGENAILAENDLLEPFFNRKNSNERPTQPEKYFNKLHFSLKSITVQGSEANDGKNQITLSQNKELEDGQDIETDPSKASNQITMTEILNIKKGLLIMDTYGSKLQILCNEDDKSSLAMKPTKDIVFSRPVVNKTFEF